MSEAPSEVGKKRKIILDESKGCRITKSGRMQCEGIASGGKRCRSYEPTLGARFCSTHILQRSAIDNGSVGYVTEHGKRQCEGITNSSGKQCRFIQGKHGARFCHLHAYQHDSQKLGRVCCGIWANGKSCINLVPLPDSGPVLAPLCPSHTYQAKTLRMERCQWADEDGISCVRYLPTESTRQRYFCDQHMVHATSKKYSQRPVTTVPDDILMVIMDKLQPEERVAFALASKACASLVKAWGMRDQPATWSSAATLEPIVVVKICTAKKYSIFMGSDPADLDVVAARKASNPYVGVHRPFSAASLEALNTAYRGCMQSEVASTCPDCIARVDHRMQPRADGDRVSITLKSIWSLIENARKEFPFLFKSTGLFCMFCRDTGNMKDWGHLKLCAACKSRSKEMLAQWCTACHGRPRPLHLARMFWQTQKPRQIKDIWP